MSEVLEVLLMASERAACVARSCTEFTCESLVVTEKCNGDSNARFNQDFKTIADVLAQESAKIEISNRFPELAVNLRGEECAEISGHRIRICETTVETTELLTSIIPAETAKIMARAAHKDIYLSMSLPADLPEIDPSDLGVWIDPIDATAEFIAGVQGQAGAECGLDCVTVLIGAYLKSTGEPVVGVINQPFYNDGIGRIIWGINYNDTKIHGGTSQAINDNKIILISGAEKASIKSKIEVSEWTAKSIPGAGNKLMNVALGAADAYIVSQGTTYRWDTCAPHAILRARGGDIVSFIDHVPLKYNDPQDNDIQSYCNKKGLIAYTDSSVFEKIVKILK